MSHRHTVPLSFPALFRSTTIRERPGLLTTARFDTPWENIYPETDDYVYGVSLLEYHAVVKKSSSHDFYAKDRRHLYLLPAPIISDHFGWGLGRWVTKLQVGLDVSARSGIVDSQMQTGVVQVAWDVYIGSLSTQKPSLWLVVGEVEERCESRGKGQETRGEA